MQIRKILEGVECKRLSLGMTQEWMAAVFGVHRSTYASWIAGRTAEIPAESACLAEIISQDLWNGVLQELKKLWVETPGNMLSFIELTEALRKLWRIYDLFDDSAESSMFRKKLLRQACLVILNR